MAFGEGLAPHAQGNRNMRLAALAVGALAVVFFLSRRGASSSSASGYTSQDLQNAAASAAQQQAQADQVGYGTPSTFADNGSQAAQLGDAVTQGLSGVATALQDLQSSVGTAGSVPTTAAPPDAGVAAVGALGLVSAAAISALGNGGKSSGGGQASSAPSSTKPGARPAVGSSAGPHGAVVAPYGHSAPPAKAGFKTVGTGGGGWVYVPVPKTTTVRNHGTGAKFTPASKTRK